MSKLGYRKGVPMGGDISDAPKGRAPTFLVSAARDPESAPLEKLQVIKGWIENGEENIRVYDVACANGAKPHADSGRCPASEASVNLETCAIDQRIGDPQLATTWTDPDFDADQPALYYVRVLEQPVCRWSKHDALRIGVAPPPHVPDTIKERAWTSPI